MQLYFNPATVKMLSNSKVYHCIWKFECFWVISDGISYNVFIHLPIHALSNESQDYPCVEQFLYYQYFVAEPMIAFSFYYPQSVKSTFSFHVHFSILVLV